MTDLMTELLHFRTVWMRAIAQAWMDDRQAQDKPSFKDRLVNRPRETLEAAFGYKWPWETVDLEVAEDPGFKWVSAHSGQCHHLRRRWWWWLKCSLSCKWDWTRAKKIECIHLKLPLTPPTHCKPKAYSAALADFYTSQPTLFGTDRKNVIGEDLARAEEAAGALTTFGRLDKSVNESEPFIGSANEFANFQVAILTFISVCWKNGKPGKTTELAQALFGKLYPKYKIPWDMLITVEDDEHAEWNEKSGQWKCSRHVLRILLPTQPQEVRDFAVALAAYNATGAEYPFTCCCAW